MDWEKSAQENVKELDVIDGERWVCRFWTKWLEEKERRTIISETVKKKKSRRAHFLMSSPNSANFQPWPWAWQNFPLVRNVASGGWTWPIVKDDMQAGVGRDELSKVIDSICVGELKHYNKATFLTRREVELLVFNWAIWSSNLS